MTLSRRRFLGAAGGAGLLTATGAWRLAAPALTTSAAPPAPANSGIEHIVVVMMENRSFDHFLGWLPTADGKQAGLSYVDAVGQSHSTYPLSGEFNGCAHPDPDHSYEGGRVQYDNGSMDGWLHTGSHDDDFALGYYVETDRPFMSALARNFTTLDRYFCSILAETYPNRFYMHSATTDRLHNNGVASASISPTIWDRLADAGVSGTYYFNDLPFLALWGTKYASISAHYSQFLADAAAGTLPAVSFVDPHFETEGSPASSAHPPNDAGGGTSNDDHPHADIRAGDHFLAEIYRALTLGPNWSNTVLIINYDEWGGFFDHVAPPLAVSTTTLDDVNGQALLGFRVPCIIASPFTKGDPNNPRVRGASSGQILPYDHASVLKLIEWRFGLPSMTKRDAPGSDVGNVLEVFNFATPDASAPSLPFPLPPPPNPCGPTNPAPTSAAADGWAQLRASDLLNGWDLP